jgi:VCBS repeat protein
MRRHCVVAIWAIAFTPTTRPPDIPFRIQTIDLGASETAAVADINRDGRLDIVSGDSWYESPRWTKHTFRELNFSNNYVDAFSDLPIDVDGDGYPDIATVTWFGRKISWYRNPGKSTGPWAETAINSGFNVEFALLVDMDNDGRPREILAQENGTGQSWYEVKDPSTRVDGGARSGQAGWVKHVVSDRSYGHGIGAGDVNGDQRNDILTPRGWLEAPADPRAGNWTYHAAWESVNTPITPRDPPNQQPPPNPAAPPRVAELGFIHVLDVNGDGRNDVLTAAGHDYGVFWFEQEADGKWTRRMIDASWSQGHASTLVDLNGDGRLDLVTGKRFMAHNGTDPGEKEPLGVYWYEFRPVSRDLPAGAPAPAAGAAAVEWIKHLVDYSSRMGGGVQIPVVDIDADGDPDLVCPGKSGLFLVENLTKSATARTGDKR